MALGASPDQLIRPSARRARRHRALACGALLALLCSGPALARAAEDAAKERVLRRAEAWIALRGGKERWQLRRSAVVTPSGNRLVTAHALVSGSTRNGLVQRLFINEATGKLVTSHRVPVQVVSGAELMKRVEGAGSASAQTLLAYLRDNGEVGGSINVEATLRAISQLPTESLRLYKRRLVQTARRAAELQQRNQQERDLADWNQLLVRLGAAPVAP